MDKVDWSCAQGHTWSAAAKVVAHGSWCPSCKGQNAAARLRKSYGEVQALCQERGFTLVSTSAQYAADPKRVLLRCANGHVHPKAPGKIQQGQGCPSCSSSRGERIAAMALAHLFGHAFPKVRPNWLVGDRGRALELDGFCVPLAIAFEYQGPHHGEVSPWGNAAADVQARDARKAQLCRDHGVTLVKIPMFSPRQYASDRLMMEHVGTAVQAAGRTPPPLGTVPDLLVATQNRTDLTDMHAWGQRVGLVCHATVFRSPRSAERWTCTQCQEDVVSSWTNLRKSRAGRTVLGCGRCLGGATRRQGDPSYGRLTTRVQAALSGPPVRTVAELCRVLSEDGHGPVLLASVWRVLHQRPEWAEQLVIRPGRRRRAA